MSTDTAIENAVRLLEAAEMETDLVKMERYNCLADSWVSLACLANDRERV